MEGAVLNEEFMKQFSGSASANLLFIVAFFVLSACKKLCARNSRCHSKFHSCCLDVDIDDRTIRSEGEKSNLEEVWSIVALSRDFLPVICKALRKSWIVVNHPPTRNYVASNVYGNFEVVYPSGGTHCVFLWIARTYIGSSAHVLTLGTGSHHTEWLLVHLDIGS